MCPKLFVDVRVNLTPYKLIQVRDASSKQVRAFESQYKLVKNYTMYRGSWTHMGVVPIILQINGSSCTFEEVRDVSCKLLKNCTCSSKLHRVSSTYSCQLTCKLRTIGGLVKVRVDLQSFVYISCIFCIFVAILAIRFA